MRFYIKNMGNGSFVIHKETTFQSIISDLLTTIVLIVAVGLDIVFSLMVTHSFIIDIIALIVVFTYFYSASKRKKKISKDELIELLNKD